MKRLFLVTLVMTIMTCGMLMWAAAAMAGDRPRDGTIRVTDGTIGQSQEVRLEVVLDDVPNLAGLKLVLEYDPEILEYAGLRKATVAGSLMHMVNPRQAGRVIVVMAGARGIALDNEPIMEVAFRLKDLEGKDVPEATEVRIPEVEAMTDTLKNIPMRVAHGQVRMEKR